MLARTISLSHTKSQPHIQSSLFVILALFDLPWLLITFLPMLDVKIERDQRLKNDFFPEISYWYSMSSWFNANLLFLLCFKYSVHSPWIGWVYIRGFTKKYEKSSPRSLIIRVYGNNETFFVRYAHEVLFAIVASPYVCLLLRLCSLI